MLHPYVLHTSVLHNRELTDYFHLFTVYRLLSLVFVFTVYRLLSLVFVFTVSQLLSLVVFTVYQLLSLVFMFTVLDYFHLLCSLPTDRLLYSLCSMPTDFSLVVCQTVGLGMEHASILLFCKTSRLVTPVWGEVELKEKELDSEEGRLALFSQLLAATSLASEYRALCQLLRLWPPFTGQ